MAETINLYTSNVLGAPPTLSFEYPLDAAGPQLQKKAMQNLGMNYDPRYSLFLASESQQTKPQKIKGQYTLRSLGASDGMTLYIALVDPITGKTIENESQQQSSDFLSQPDYSLNNNNYPSQAKPKPLISQNKMSARVKAPPSILSVAQNHVNSSRNTNVKLTALNNNNNNSIKIRPSLYKNNPASNLPPIAPKYQSNQLPKINNNRVSAPRTPTAQNTPSPRTSLPAFGTSAKVVDSEINEDDAEDEVECIVDTDMYPIPDKLQPYKCSIDDYKTIKKIGKNVQIVQDKSTDKMQYLKILRNTTQDNIFYDEFAKVFDAENGAILHLSGFITSPQSLVYDYSTISHTLEDILEAERISSSPNNWNNTTKTIVLFGIAEGMRQLHSKKIMHRNLKPSNIFLDSNYNPYVADAGFTREYNRDPLYTAPEILAEKEYKSKVDVYAYGMICYHVLVTRPPFDPKLSLHDLKQNIINGERPEIPTTIPQPFVTIMQQCWQPQSSQRPSFSKIVEAFAKKILILPGADLDSVIEFQRSIVPQYEAKELCKTAMFMRLASKGDPQGMLDFAYCLIQGKGVIKNVPEAQKYFRLSAESGSDQGMFEYARMLIKYGGDHEEAVEYMKKSARNGNREAQKFLTNPYNSYIIQYGTRNIKTSNSKSRANTANKKRDNSSSRVNTATKRNETSAKSNDNDTNDNKPAPVINNNTVNGKDIDDEYYKLGKDLINKNPAESFANFLKSANQGNVKAQLRVAISYQSGINGAKKNLEEANKYYQLAANQGNMKAQCNLAFNMQKGDGIEKDIKAANALYKKSADLGYSIAQFNYAYNLMNGIGIDKDYKEASRYFKLAADQGLSNAQYSYGLNLMKGSGVEKDAVEAIKYLKMSADSGNAQAQCQLAINYMNGVGVEKDLAESYRYNKMAADQGNSRAICNCAFALQNGNGVEKDLTQANNLYKLAADKKYALAQLSYGLNLESGTGVDRNVIEANKYYKMAADQGNSNAQFNYGMNLFKGNGIKKDVVAANNYLKMSSEQNNSKAMYQYGINLLKGNGCDKDPALANQYLKKSADAGNVNAQFYYGYNLYNGNGIEKNPEEANKYYKLAADKGNANCQCNLACSYLNGIGVPKDLQMANKYYKMSADQGNSVAQYNYGYHLLNGTGVEADVEKAIEYLQMAAESNNSSALYHLAICYENGTGVEKNLQKSQELLKKSESLGNKLAKRKLGK